MPHLEVQQTTKRFGRFVALDAVDLAIEHGELVVLLGPSGCGKTTLLRVIAGLERQDQGRIFHAGQEISQRAPSERDYGIVFQSYALFPNLTVSDNVGYGLKSRHAPRTALHQRVEAMLELVGLPGSGAKYPAQLSGGQQQRIALARALATAPDLLLLDEPLSALDAIERVRLRAEIRSLQRRLGVTTLMVTHDQEEALAMADRMVVMKDGRIQQIGSPHTIYRQPSNEFVADFIGRGNLIEAERVGSHHVRSGNLLLRTGAPLSEAPKARFFVRPEDIRLQRVTDGGENGCYARVRRCEFLGAYTLVTLDLLNAGAQTLVAQFSSNYLEGRELVPEAIVRMAIPPEHLQPLPEAGA
jgi:iron(III) transport system ATP-binding protein